MSFMILLGVCCIEGVLLVRRRSGRQGSVRRKREEGPISESKVYSYQSNADMMNAESEPVSRPPSGDLTGTLDNYSIGQIVQFFNSSGDSGRLVVDPASGEASEICFHEGHIISASIGKLDGENAVYAILRSREGSFIFHREDMSNVPRVIFQDTMSLLLEGSRLADEQGMLETA